MNKECVRTSRQDLLVGGLAVAGLLAGISLLGGLAGAGLLIGGLAVAGLLVGGLAVTPFACARHASVLHKSPLKHAAVCKSWFLQCGNLHTAPLGPQSTLAWPGSTQLYLLLPCTC